MGCVGRLHQVLQDVDVSPRLVFREVSPHARLQRTIESFNDARLSSPRCEWRSDGCHSSSTEPEWIYSDIRVLDLHATSVASFW